MMKIVVCGPPHSGKSVFVSVLRGMLPRERFMLVEGAPDGEGVTGWSHEADAALAKTVRRKGTFLPEFVDWVCHSIQNSTAHITIVDVGGRRSPENERIFRVCDHFVVISSNPEETRLWVEFGESLGLTPLAILDSSLEGKDKIISEDKPLRARITRLERECPPVGSTAARAVARRILETAGEGDRQLDGSEQADVNFPLLAEELGIPLLNGGPDREWTPEVLPRFLEVAMAQVANPREVKLWGNCSAGFPYHTLACALEARVRYYDPKIPGYVPLPEVRPQGEGSQLLDWRVEERDDHTLIEFIIPGQIFDVFDLPMVVPPAALTDKGVVIFGKGPWWLTGTIARSYCHAGVKWVSVFASRESNRLTADGCKWSEIHPDCGPALVIASRDQQVPIGTVLPFRLPKNE